MVEERLIYIREYKNEHSGHIEKYSIDIEEANDSHYELSSKNMEILRQYLSKVYDNEDIEVCIKEYYKSHEEWEIKDLFGKLDISFKEFHFDNWDDF